jgi:hypothetical protein
MRITIDVELYNQHKLVDTQTGDLIVHILKNAVSDRLKELDFPEEGFFCVCEWMLTFSEVTET